MLRLPATQGVVQPFHELRRHLVGRGIDDAAQRRQERGHAPDVQFHRNELVHIVFEVLALQRQQVADFAVRHHVLVHEQFDSVGDAGLLHVFDGGPRLHGFALQLVRNAGHVADAAHVFLAQQRVPHEGAHASGLRFAGFERRDGGLDGRR